MSAHAYTEDQLVEQPAIALFAELGWSTVSAMDEVFGASSISVSSLGRETSGEVFLLPRLRDALSRLNPQLPAEAITSAVDELTRDRSAMSLAAANREIHTLLRDGVKVTVAELRKAVADASAYCKKHHADLDKIETASAENFARAQAVEDAANRLLAPEAIKRDFMAHARLVDALFRAVKPDPVAVEFAQRCGSIKALADFIRNCTEPPDISEIMQGIQKLLDDSIGAEPFKIKQRSGGGYGIDLSKIDFAALAKRFEKKKPTSSDLERLKAAVKAQLERMVRLNRTRADYLQKFEELIEAYNSGSRNIEDIFKDLLTLTQTLTEEEDRHVRENLSEEELTVFDILTRPGPELSAEERDEVKKVAHQLLERLNEVLVLGWRQKTQARARVKIAIEDTLDEGLPRAYSKDIYSAKCDVLFEHVYESYFGDGGSVYAQPAR